VIRLPWPRRRPTRRELSLQKQLADQKAAFDRCYDRARTAEMKEWFLRDQLTARTAERDALAVENAALTSWKTEASTVLTDLSDEHAGWPEVEQARCHAENLLQADIEAEVTA
jgi:hypothetical protein